MNILCIMHADFETPGVIEKWAYQNNHTFTICKPYLGEKCLDNPNIDFLIIMGGPQSPLTIENDPYLHDEIELIKKIASQNKLILGFCLGAQLIGEAFGAKTLRSPEKEVGIFPIFLNSEGLHDPLLEGLPGYFNVIHWHNDMPGKTPNAKVLAFSEGCPQQIVKYASNIYGFQCHLEITLEGIENMIQACPNDLKKSAYTQSSQALLEQDYSAINELMYKILDKMVSLNQIKEPCRIRA